VSSRGTTFPEVKTWPVLSLMVLVGEGSSPGTSYPKTDILLKGVKKLTESKKPMLSEAAVHMSHSGHERHLCYFQNIGLLREKLDEYKKLIRDAKYVCKDCGRSAANPDNLCFPEKI
jgi:hypothetical protein